MTHHTDAELLRDIEEHMRNMWDARLLPAVCWPADLAQRLTQAVRRAPASQGMDASTSIGTLWVEENGANDLELCPCAAPKLPPGEYALFARTKQGGA